MADDYGRPNVAVIRSGKEAELWAESYWKALRARVVYTLQVEMAREPMNDEVHAYAAELRCLQRIDSELQADVRAMKAAKENAQPKK